MLKDIKQEIVEAAGGPYKQQQVGRHSQRWYFKNYQDGRKRGNAKKHHSIGNDPLLRLQIRQRACDLPAAEQLFWKTSGALRQRSARRLPFRSTKALSGRMHLEGPEQSSNPSG